MSFGRIDSDSKNLHTSVVKNIIAQNIKADSITANTLVGYNRTYSPIVTVNLNETKESSSDKPIVLSPNNAGTIFLITEPTVSQSAHVHFEFSGTPVEGTKWRIAGGDLTTFLYFVSESENLKMLVSTGGSYVRDYSTSSIEIVCIDTFEWSIDLTVTYIKDGYFITGMALNASE